MLELNSESEEDGDDGRDSGGATSSPTSLSRSPMQRSGPPVARIISDYLSLSLSLFLLRKLRDLVRPAALWPIGLLKVRTDPAQIQPGLPTDPGFVDTFPKSQPIDSIKASSLCFETTTERPRIGDFANGVRRARCGEIQEINMAT